MSYDLPTAEVANWVPSPLDGPTPGAPNPTTGTPARIVQTLSAAAVTGTPLIRRTDEVVVRAGLSPYGSVGAVRLEYFVDDLERTDETDDGRGHVASGGQYEVRLPARSDNTIVRYRVLADLGSGLQVLSPRPSDPFRYHAYFVSPSLASAQPPYQLFINSKDWGQLWTNVNFASANDRRVVPETIGGSTVRCQLRQSWDGRVPAVFVSEGRVYDVRVRYQGSRWNRPVGSAIDLGRTSISPLPDPMMAGSSGGSTQSPGAQLEHQLSPLRPVRGEAGPADPEQAQPVLSGPGRRRGRTPVRSRRLALQPGALPTRLRQRRLLRLRPRHRGPRGRHAQAGHPTRRAGGRPVQGLGQLRGGGRSLGPRGWAAAHRQLRGPHPSFQPLERYGYNYERKTWDWKDAWRSRTLIVGLDAARVAGNLNDSNAGNDNLAPVRTFIDQNFDIEAMLNYIAIRNWAEPWDDIFHNQFLYRNASGRWSFIPWDLDREFGENFGWDAPKSFFLGERGDPDNRNGDWNRIKDAFIRAYRTELVARLQELATYDPSSFDPKRGVLAPERFKPIVDLAAAGFDQTDWNASPVTNLCDFTTEKNSLKTFGDERHSALLDLIACSSRPCGLKGEYFDARTFNSSDLILTRTDRVVSFDFGTAAPVSGVPDRQLPDPLDRESHARPHPDLHLLHPVQRRGPPLGQRRPADQQLDQPHLLGGQQHDRPDRRRPGQHPPRVLRQHRQRPHPPLLVRPLPTQTNPPRPRPHPRALSDRDSPASGGAGDQHLVPRGPEVGGVVEDEGLRTPQPVHGIPVDIQKQPEMLLHKCCRQDQCPQVGLQAEQAG